MRDAVALDAILDHELPTDMAERKGAFFGAIDQMAAISEPPLHLTELADYIRNLIQHDNRAMIRRLFEYTTPRSILDQAEAMWPGPGRERPCRS